MIQNQKHKSKFFAQNQVKVKNERDPIDVVFAIYSILQHWLQDCIDFQVHDEMWKNVIESKFEIECNFPDLI